MVQQWVWLDLGGKYNGWFEWADRKYTLVHIFINNCFITHKGRKEGKWMDLKRIHFYFNY